MGCNILVYIIHCSGLNYVKEEGSILFLIPPVSLTPLIFSLSLFASPILSSWLLFVSKMDFLFFILIRVRIILRLIIIGFVLSIWDITKGERSQKIYYIIKLTSFCSYNSFMTIKQVLFLIFSENVKIYYSIATKNFDFIMAHEKDDEQNNLVSYFIRSSILF